MTGKHAAERFRIKTPFAGRQKKHVPEKVARPTRTGIQYVIGYWLGVEVNQHLPHVIDHQRAYVIGACAALVSAAWVAVEDHFGRAVLRSVPPKEVPAVD